MRKRSSFHLRHDLKPMVLGGARADAEARSDHFVRITFDKKREHFPLARR